MCIQGSRVDEVGRFPQNLAAKPTKYFAKCHIARALRSGRAGRACGNFNDTERRRKLTSFHQSTAPLLRSSCNRRSQREPRMFARSCMLGPGNLFRSCDMFIHMITCKSRSCDLSPTQQVDNRENGSKNCAKAMLSGMIVQGLNFQEVYRST